MDVGSISVLCHAPKTGRCRPGLHTSIDSMSFPPFPHRLHVVVKQHCVITAAQLHCDPRQQTVPTGRRLRQRDLRPLPAPRALSLPRPQSRQRCLLPRTRRPGPRREGPACRVFPGPLREDGVCRNSALKLWAAARRSQQQQQPALAVLLKSELPEAPSKQQLGALSSSSLQL